ncbi:hypothetical protein ACLLO4_37420 [Kutzneria viridogrisea]|nr:hypothetical protein [Kutzneria albida]
MRQRAAAAQRLEDAKADARRWVERLGGQVMNLTGTNDAAKQALADASERYTAAGSQMEQARTEDQCKLVTQTAMEGLYYVRAARTAMGMDPGPELPDLNGQSSAGKVTEDRRVDVEGHEYEASANPGENTPHYYPGGMVAGRPVPQGWYSEPWWKPALVAGAWGVGSALLFNAMFSGMHSLPYAAGGWGDHGYGGGWGDQVQPAAFETGGNQGGGWDGGGGGWDGGGDQGGGWDFGGGGWDGGGDFGGGGGDNW